jgi:glycosyltransferase involved in cell wall biosynthesis
MLQFLFFGRLDKEKWRDAIIAMIEHFAIVSSNPQISMRSLKDRKSSNNSYASAYSVPESDGQFPFVFHIFGKGRHEQDILNLAKRYPVHIIYYGFQPLETIKNTAKKCDYCLMPSHFLETFWLSAINALSRWLPVIGYQQWGMTPFVLDAYNLWSNTGSPAVHLIAMMEKLLLQWPHNDSEICKKIAEKYGKKEWIQKINKLMYPTWITSSSLRHSSQWHNQKILLVTDFLDKMGGIETYVHDVAMLLTEQWHTVEIVWSSWWKTKISRIFSMLLSTCNVFFAWKLQKKINTFQPDIIRCHSVLRYIGWLWLHMINRSRAQKWIMYHDLWYISAFPHTISNEKDIPATLSWNDFSSAIDKSIQKLFVFGKRYLLKLIWKQLKKFDTQLVPSNFMTNYIAKESNSSIIILPHFIQE